MADGTERAVTPAGRMGARIGILVGFTAWIVMFGVLALARGRTDLLLPVVLPVLLASLGLGLLTTFAAETAPASRRLPLVFGAIAFASGLLLLLADAFVVPALESDPRLGNAVTATGGVLSLPHWLRDGLLLVGAALLAVALRAPVQDRRE